MIDDLSRRAFAIATGGSLLTTGFAAAASGAIASANLRMPGSDRIRHQMVAVNGTRLHVARVGKGPPLLLLHGWPEFWLTWEPVMLKLADRFELIAPDLRGFGDSDKPVRTFGPEQQAGDMAALIDALGVGPVGLVAHDIGGAIAQALARKAPEKLAGLFFFDFIYPGVGTRFTAQDRLERVWYFFFHETEFAPPLIGATPDSIRSYLTHFLKLWPYRKDAFDDVMEDFVASYQKPGNVAGSLAHYRASKLGQPGVPAPTQPAPIRLPTCVRWSEHDLLFDYAWTDRLDEFFPGVDLALFPGVGHFPHREDPARAAHEIGKFYAALAAGGWKERKQTVHRT